MTATSLYPAHVVRSFDKLTEIVCMSNLDKVKETVTRLVRAGKIDKQEGGIVLHARYMLDNGLDDAAFSSWNFYCSAAMETATPRKFRFLEWADTIAEVSYCNPPE